SCSFSFSYSGPSPMCSERGAGLSGDHLERPCERDLHLDPAAEQVLQHPVLLAAGVDLAGFWGVVFEMAGDLKPAAGQGKRQLGRLNRPAVQRVGGLQEAENEQQVIEIVSRLEVLAVGRRLLAAVMAGEEREGSPLGVVERELRCGEQHPRALAGMGFFVDAAADVMD